jgi:molecular chaperone DnaK (HSP70)
VYNSKNFHARLCPDFLEIIPTDYVKVNVTEILSLKSEDKERLNSHALERMNEWERRILSRVPQLRQLSEEQVTNDLATYLDENEIAEFQKCLADIRQWLSECMDTGDRYFSYAYATWVVTPMSRAENLVAKAY